jgi:hypothetical protein
MKEIHLKGLKSSIEGGVLRVEAEVEGIDPLWFELGQEYQELVDSESVDAFFLLYTWLAMEAGFELVVDGKVSQRMALALTGKVKDMFLALCPRLRDIKIRVNNPCEAWGQSSLGCATGFSGGVDSWFTALKSIEKGDPFEGYLFTNTGQHGEHNIDEVFVARANVAREISRTLEKPFITVNSNIDNLFKERFQQRHSISNLACALLLQRGFSQYSYAAGFTAKDSAVVSHTDMAVMDAFLLPLLATERMSFISCGDEAGRIEKLDYLSTFKQFSNELYVCIEKSMPVKNCGTCFKCRRTQMALYCLGLTDVLAKSFDLEKFNKTKTLSMIGLMASSKTNTSDLEIVEALNRRYGQKIFHIRLMSQIWSFIKKNLPGSLKWRSMAKAPYLW